MSAHEYVPTGTQKVRAWQVDFNDLAECWELFKTLYTEYDVKASFHVTGSGKLAILIVQDPYNVTVSNMDWVVCGESVKKMETAEFHQEYRKAGKE